MAVFGTVVLAVQLWAQRGGHGGMGGGGVRGGAVARSGFSGSASHGGSSGSGSSNYGHSGSGSGSSGHSGSYTYHHGHYSYYHRYYQSYRYGYPWSYGGVWYGGAVAGWPDSSGSYPAESYPVYSYPPPDNSNALLASQQQEIDRLNDQVAGLRAERTPAPAPQAAPAETRTVLVFRDRHVEQIQDYAIVNNTLWVFTQLKTRKIPISELDIPATTKVNEDRGTDFRLPGQ